MDTIVRRVARVTNQGDLAAASQLTPVRPASATRLYNQESARVMGVAQRIGWHNALAEDIDVFIKIWTRAASFDPSRGSARGWIFSITRHLALTVVRGDNAKKIQIDAHSEMALDTLAPAEGPGSDNFNYQAHSGRI